MSNKLYEENDIHNIADGIRQMSGLRNQMRVSEMSDSIKAIPRRPVVPDYWKSEVDTIVQKVRTLKKNGGNNEYQFVLASDLHYRASIGDNNYGRNIGNLASYIMNACYINYFAITGDLVTNAVETSKELMENNVDYILDKLAPVGRDRLIIAEGNHDIAYGTNYRTHFTKEEVDAIFYEPLKFNSNYHFSEDGSYYYLDDENVRFIVLNSFWTANHEVNSDGTSMYDHFNRGGYGQKQIEWLANTALNFEENGKIAVILSHMPMTGAEHHSNGYTFDDPVLCRDNTIVQGIINAYINKTTYTGSHIYSASLGEGEWANVNISVDYSNVQHHANVMLICGGHCHMDSIVKDKLPCIISTITCATNSSYDDTEETRVNNSITETAFDIISLNKETGLINFIRVGVGDDRVANMNTTYYTVKQNLTNCTSDSIITSVEEGSNIIINLYPVKDATMGSITVTVGGIDVTNSVVSGNKITISDVNGDVVIIGNAIKPATNWIPLSINSDGTEYIGTNGEDGYKVGYRIDSSGAEVTYDSHRVTGFIPAKNKDVIYMSGIQTTQNGGLNAPYLGVYDSTFQKVYAGTFDSLDCIIDKMTDSYGNITQFRLNTGIVAYIRVCSYTLDADSIITVNEPIFITIN